MATISTPCLSLSALLMPVSISHAPCHLTSKSQLLVIFFEVQHDEKFRETNQRAEVITLLMTGQGTGYPEFSNLHTCADWLNHCQFPVKAGNPGNHSSNGSGSF